MAITLVAAPRRRLQAGFLRMSPVAITLAVVGVSTVLAVPKLIASSSDGDVLVVEPGAVPPAPPPAPVVVPAVASAPAPQVSDLPATPQPETVHEADAPPPPPVVATTPDGDLAIEIVPKVATAVSGASVSATVRFANHGTKGFHLPAAGEPHPTLSIVILDGEANEVRRIVETGPDPYPRRTTTLHAGAVMEMQALLVSPDDQALPPGDYTIYAEFRRDPSWTRLGLPMWTAPRGAVRSGQSPLKVLPRE